MGCGIGYGYLHRIPIDEIVQQQHLQQKPKTEGGGSVMANPPPSPADMGAKTTITPIVAPPGVMTSPVIGTMPPPPVNPVVMGVPQASPAAAPVPPPVMMPQTPPNSEVTSTASSQETPTPQLSAAPQVPIFGTGTSPAEAAFNQQMFVPPPAAIPAQQFPLPPANMPIPDPAVLAGMPPPPTGLNMSSFMVPTSVGGEEQQQQS